MTAPETIARQLLIDALETEFAAEGFPVRSDRLHPSLGEKGTVIGVFPEESIPSATNRDVGQFAVRVQFFGKWKKLVDPEQRVDPSKVEAYAERFRNMVRTAVDPIPGTGQLWYFTLDRINYPPDPTGNTTRFEAFLTARGNNSALIETTE